MAKARTQPGRSRSARRADPEQMTRILLVGGVIAVLLIVAGVIAFGWYQTEIKPGGKTVLRVENTDYSLNDVIRRAKLSMQENSLFQDPRYGQAIAATVMLQLEREAKLIEAAGTLGDQITVSDEDIDNKIKANGSLAADADARAFAAEYSKQVEASGLSRDEFRLKIKAELLEEKVRNLFLYFAPEEEPQVRAKVIRVEDVSAARDARDRLAAGEDFGAIAREVSQDSASAEKGGEVDWAPRGFFGADEVEDFLFDDADVGQTSEIIETDLGAFIVQLIEKADVRPLTAEQKQLVANRELEAWYEKQDDELTIERNLSEEDTNRVLNAVY
jgi:parvulin-like peptidyl-prolyl isomerase